MIFLSARYPFVRRNKNSGRSVCDASFPACRKPVSWAVWSPNLAPHRGNSEKAQLHLLHLRFLPTRPLYFTHTGQNSQLQAITWRTHWLTVSRLPLDGSQIEKDSLGYGQCKSISGIVSSRQLVGQTKGCGFENSGNRNMKTNFHPKEQFHLSKRSLSLSLWIANIGQSKKYLNVFQDILLIRLTGGTLYNLALLRKNVIVSFRIIAWTDSWL